MEQPQASRTRTEDATQLLITLSDCDVLRIETLDRSGKKQEVADADFATLVGDEEAQDLISVLEHAYMAGFSDGSADGLESGADESHGEADEDDLEMAMMRGVASRRLIRRAVRRLILARLLKRELLRKHAPVATVPASETSH